MKLRIYTDTSVLGGCEDEEFAEHSIRLVERFVLLVLSSLTVQELAAAPPGVLRRVAAVPEAHIETLSLDAESKDLADAYIAAACSRPECWRMPSTSRSRQSLASTCW